MCCLARCGAHLGVCDWRTRAACWAVQFIWVWGPQGCPVKLLISEVCELGLQLISLGRSRRGCSGRRQPATAAHMHAPLPTRNGP